MEKNISLTEQPETAVRPEEIGVMYEETSLCTETAKAVRMNDGTIRKTIGITPVLSARASANAAGEVSFCAEEPSAAAAVLTVNKEQAEIPDAKLVRAAVALSGEALTEAADITVNGKSYHMEPGETTAIDITAEYAAAQDAYTLEIEAESPSALAALTAAAASVDVWYLNNEEVHPTKKTFALCGNASGELNLYTGEFVTTYTDVPAEDSVLGVEIAHVFRESTEDFHCGSNARLTLNETLKPLANATASEPDYVYTDALGDQHGFKEYFYYLDNNNARQEVAKADVTVQLDGTLTDGTHVVTRELRSSTGLKAVTELMGLTNEDLYEQRRDEVKQLEEQINAYRNVIEDYQLVLKSTGAVGSQSGKAILDAYETELNSASATTHIILSSSEAVQYSSLLEQKASLSETIDNDSGTFIYPNMPEIKKQVISLKSALYELNWKLKGYLTDDEIRNDTSTVNDITNIINSDLAVPTSYINKFLNSAAGYDYVEGDSKTASKGYTVREQFRQRNLILEQIKITEKDVDDQSNLIQKQIDYMLGRENQNYEQLKTYYKEYVNKQEELATLKRHLPVRYLTDGTIIKGFNENGDLVAIFDRYENSVTIERDRTDRIMRVYDGEKEVSFAYNADGKLISITDARGRTTKFGYNDNKLIGIVSFNQNSITFYYSNNRISSFVGKNDGGTLNYSNNKLSSFVRFLGVDEIRNGEVTLNTLGNFPYLYNYTVNYSTSNTQITDSNAKTTEVYYFDGNGRLTQYREELDGKIIRAERYTVTPRQSAKTEYAKKSSLYTTSASGYTFVVGDTVNNTLNAFNQVTKSVKSAVQVDSTGTTRQETVTYTYDNNLQLIREQTVIATEIMGNTTNRTFYRDYFYNAQGRLVRTERYENGKEYTEGKAVEETVYDQNGNAIKTFTYNSLDSGSKFYTESEYGEKGQVLSDYNETGEHKTAYEYLEGSNLVRTKILPNGGKLSCGHDLTNAVTAITQSTEEGEENSTQISYTYGLATKLTSGSNTVEYTYDAKKRVKSVKLNSEDPYVTYTYTDNETENGKTVDKVTATYANDDTATVTTDKAGNVLETKYNGVTQTTAVYAADGKMTSKTDQVIKCTTASTYDSVDHIRKYEVTKNTGAPTGISAVTETFTYLPDGRPMQRAIAIGSKSDFYNYSFDDPLKQNLTAISYNGSINYNIAIKRDLQGRNAGKDISISGNAVEKLKYGYRKVGDHATNQISTISYKNGKRLRYAYDESGNIARIYENEALIIRYTYDQLNRLIREDNKPLNKTYLIAYDNNGNILSKESFSYSLGKREELQTTVPTLWLYDGDRLISNGNGSNGYDSMGNPTTYQGKSVTWSKGRQMTAFGSTSFAYDGSGKRYQKGSLYFTYGSDGKLLCQSNGMEFIYDHEGAVGFKYNGSLYAYRKNAQGDVIEILDSTGSVVVKYTYNAWGEHKVCDNTGAENTTSDFIGNLNPIRYRSYYYDVETQLYYLNTRYYDPAVGRFINADDISYLDPETINGLNLYAYCVNNPVMFVDPTGEWSWSAFWNILAGIVIVVALTAVVVFTAGFVAMALGAGLAVINGVMTGAAIGGLIAGGGELIGQIITGGAENINLGSVAIETFIGSVYGAISGVAATTTSAGLNMAMRGAKIALSGVAEVLRGINGNQTFGEIMKNAGTSMAISAGVQMLSFGFYFMKGYTTTSMIELMSLDKSFTFGVVQMVLLGGILAGKSIWNTYKGDIKRIIWG